MRASHFYPSIQLGPVPGETALLDAAPGEIGVLRNALRPRQVSLAPRLWAIVNSVKSDDPRLVTSASALALFDPENPRWIELGAKIRRGVCNDQPGVHRNVARRPSTCEGESRAPLAAIFRDKTRSETQHIIATSILRDYASDAPDLLADLLMDADPKAFESLFTVAERQSEQSCPFYEPNSIGARGRALRSTKLPGTGSPPGKHAGVAMVRLGSLRPPGPLEHSPDPRLRSFLINWLDPLGADPSAVIGEFDHLESLATRHARPGTRKMDAISVPPRNFDTPVAHSCTGQLTNPKTSPPAMPIG